MRIPPHGARSLAQQVEDHDASIYTLVDDVCTHDEALERLGSAINYLLDTRADTTARDALSIALKAMELAQLCEIEIHNLKNRKPWYKRIWRRNGSPTPRGSNGQATN